MTRAVLVGVELPGGKQWTTEESLAELAELARTAGADVAHRYVQRRPEPDPATYIGSGKAEEISRHAAELGAELVIFDDELSPAQVRNLERLMSPRVIDRTALILDIFARRARTREGKLQVELAQLMYRLPRLTGHGAELSRLGGGIGTRGPGETKLETDRRTIRKRIADLKRELREVREIRGRQRSQRRANLLPTVALCGYTNAGKSTLLGRLAQSDVYAENELFATLDPTTRRVAWRDGMEFLLTDTVGFIQKLPHQLVAAFRATLEEVVEADLLVHVVDASHGKFREQMDAVGDVLAELGAIEHPTVICLNKADLLDADERDLLSRAYPQAVMASALTGEGLESLLKAIETGLKGNRVALDLTLPYRSTWAVDYLHRHGRVDHEEYKEEGVRIRADLPAVLAASLKARLEEREAVR